MQRLMIAYDSTVWGLCIPYGNNVRVYSFYKSLVGIDPYLYSVLDAWFYWTVGCSCLRHR